MIKNYLLLYFAIFSLAFASVGCSDSDADEADMSPALVFSSNDRTFSVASAEQNEITIKFKANKRWSAQALEGATWLFFSNNGVSTGDVELTVTVGANTSTDGRTGKFRISAGDMSEDFTVNQPGKSGEAPKPPTEEIDPSTIPDYDKFWANSEHGSGMLKSNSKFSFARYKSSEHFFVFWDKYFGDDPNGSHVAPGDRVDIDDLLAKAEHFFQTNIMTLGMAVLGQGQSTLDDYKMQIYLLDPTPESWVATGSGYDDMIGALWVTPATCQPVGSTIAHEIGHSFQYQVYADKVQKQGYDHNYKHGFRYGFGDNGAGGCSYWEQCAQWQAQVDYPEEMFGYHVPTWTANCHRIFYHEWMRYASYWLQHDWVNRHGVEAYGRIWRESEFPEDPIETYTRLYNGSDIQKTYDELYDYAAHMVYYDIPGIREYATPEVKGNYSTVLFRVDDSKYQVGYQSPPGTTGFNVIRLMTSAGKSVSVKVDALETGSALAEKDPGTQVNGDGGIVGSVKRYNTQRNTSSNFRYGYVAIVDGVPQYSEMSKGATGTASYNVPAGASELYFVIMGSPDTYNRAGWDDKESNDEQWPYTITLTGTDVYNYVEPSVAVFEKVDDNTLNVTYDLSVDPENSDWIAGGLNMTVPDVTEFLGMDAATLSKSVVSPEVGKAVEKIDGKIVVFNKNADGSISNMPTANVGYWLTVDGTAIEYAEGTIYYELNGANLILGKKGAVGAPGDTMVMHPVYVYKKGSSEKTINVTVTYKFRGATTELGKRVSYSRMKLF